MLLCVRTTRGLEPRALGAAPAVAIVVVCESMYGASFRLSAQLVEGVIGLPAVSPPVRWRALHTWSQYVNELLLLTSRDSGSFGPYTLSLLPFQLVLAAGLRTTTRLTSFLLWVLYTPCQTLVEPLSLFDVANMGGSLCCILDFNKSLTIYMSIHNVFKLTC